MADLTYNTITNADDYLRLTGIDLNEELKARLTDDIGDNNPAPRFIYSVENYLKEKIITHNPIDYSSNLLNDDYVFETEHQTNLFKRAVCYQISYMLKNGNLTNESGYINNVITPRETLDCIGLDSNSIRCLKIAGLWNIRRW